MEISQGVGCLSNRSRPYFGADPYIIIIIIIYSHTGNTGKKKNVKTSHSFTQCELDYKV